MKKLIVLNHKMNLDYDYLHSYIDKINKIETSNNIIICPTSLYLESFVNNCSWGIGCQNTFYEPDGNYTGEISTTQLKSLGVEYSLVGHFERKKYFGEDNEVTRKKLEACLDTNIQPILCFGENGIVEDAIKELDELLVNIPNIDFIIFAYEPLEVSGYETKTQIEEDILQIHEHLKENYHTNANIIYGGGVIPENINDILTIECLNGILIGKISSDINEVLEVFKKID